MARTEQWNRLSQERLGCFAEWNRSQPEKCEMCVYREDDAVGPLLSDFEPCNMWLQFRRDSSHNQKKVKVISH